MLNISIIKTWDDNLISSMLKETRKERERGEERSRGWKV